MHAELEILATTPGAGVPYLFIVPVGLVGVIGILLSLNVRDSAYRAYEFLENRSPVSPGFGFSPLIIRITGALLGVSLIVQCITKFN